MPTSSMRREIQSLTVTNSPRMATPARTLRVSILDVYDDILHRIFMINSDMDNDPIIPHKFFRRSQVSSRALNVARHCSQVCRSWRRISLNSSALWARVVDLSLLWPARQDWRQEVLTRSKNGRLHIKGLATPSIEKDSPNTFLISLISNHWYRLWRLEVHLDDPHGPNPEIIPGCGSYATAWCMLTQSAPNLVSFKLTTKHLHGQPRTGMLFENNAPNLQDFIVPKILLNPQWPWLRNLERLSLTTPFIMNQVLDILKSTPLLEFLSLDEHIDAEDLDPADSVSLSYLRDLLIQHRLEVCFYIIEHIIPANGCGLILKGTYTDSILTMDALKRYASSYSDISQFNEATFYVTNYKVSFSLCISPRLLLFGDHIPPSFNITIDFQEDNTDHFLSSVIDSISVPTLSKIKSLDLRIHLADLTRHSLRANTLANFVLPFSSVDHLTTVINALPFLSQITSDSSSFVPFPALRCLKLAYAPTRLKSGSLLPFLRSRDAIGVPVSEVDLTSCTSREASSLDFLFDVVRSKITWIEEDGLLGIRSLERPSNA